MKNIKNNYVRTRQMTLIEYRLCVYNWAGLILPTFLFCFIAILIKIHVNIRFSHFLKDSVSPLLLGGLVQLCKSDGNASNPLVSS